MDIEDEQRLALTKSIRAYRGKFDDDPEFGHMFPKLYLIPWYISEISKAIKTNKPIIVKWENSKERFID